MAPASGRLGRRLRARAPAPVRAATRRQRSWGYGPSRSPRRPTSRTACVWARRWWRVAVGSGRGVGWRRPRRRFVARWSCSWPPRLPSACGRWRKSAPRVPRHGGGLARLGGHPTPSAEQL